MIRVQQDDFDIGAEIAALSADPAEGAVVTFVGKVRGLPGDLEALELDHYPGMTERQLAAIDQAALARWPGISTCIIHRYGRLHLNEKIVLVVVAAPHRTDAFAACAFLVDKLKTQAPFWKKEHRSDGHYWVQAQNADDEIAALWD